MQPDNSTIDTQRLPLHTKYDIEHTQGTTQPHQHTYGVTYSDLVVVRWCMQCGQAWRAKRVRRNFNEAFQWELIREV